MFKKFKVIIISIIVILIISQSVYAHTFTPSNINLSQYGGNCSYFASTMFKLELDIRLPLYDGSLYAWQFLDNNIGIDSNNKYYRLKYIDKPVENSVMLFTSDDLSQYFGYPFKNGHAAWVQSVNGNNINVWESATSNPVIYETDIHYLFDCWFMCRTYKLDKCHNVKYLVAEVLK